MSGGGSSSGNRIGPLVSVLLPVFNGGRHLAEAVESILAQTYANIELIVINDGSTDDSTAILDALRDERIQVHHQHNQGLAASLNRAIGLARGEYLARQDQDDFSRPTRFQKQVAFLQAHPRCGMVGTWAEILEEDGTVSRSHRHPSDHVILQFELLLDNPFVHSSMMIQKRAIDEVGPYSTNPERQPPEDYELWSRIAGKYEVMNIPEILHVYREAPNSMSRQGPRPFMEHLVTVSAENLARAAARPAVEPAATDLAALAHGAFHRLSAYPDFDQCERVLYEAADRLSDAAHVDRGLLQERARTRLRALRARYDHYRYGGVVGRLVGGVRRHILRGS